MLGTMTGALPRRCPAHVGKDHDTVLLPCQMSRNVVENASNAIISDYLLLQK
jgi:hypothetical protein